MSPREARAVRTSPAIPLALGALIAFGGPASALTLAFPDPATATATTAERLASYRLPTGPFDGKVVPTRLAEGAVEARSWRIEGADQTTLALMRAMRAQIEAQGNTVIYECEARACGGFDFRFATEVLPEPAMHVDLGDFRYLAAKRTGPDGPDHIAVIVSRSSKLGFVQVTQIGKTQAKARAVVAPTTEALENSISKTPTPLGDGLAKQGSVALDDLIFDSGAADLAPGEYASLEALAAYLRANPTSNVALVGHTDASGGLGGNIALSRARAASVRTRMLDGYAIPAGQIIAEGVGYLAPRDGNLTDQGRTRNRRVEVMLLVNP